MENWCVGIRVMENSQPRCDQAESHWQTVLSSLDLGLRRHQRSVSTEQPLSSTGL